MSFNPFAPQAALRTRLLTHVPLTTAVQGVWTAAAPDDISVGRDKKPYVVITHVPGNFDLTTFETNIADSEYQVNVFDHLVNADDAAKTVLGYVFGDSEGTDNNPTYGLARWKMTGVTDMAPTTIVPRTFGDLSDANTLHYYITFQVVNAEA